MAPFPTAILVADDGSPESDRALDTATQLAAATGSPLSLVHVKSLSPSVVGTTVTTTHMERLQAEGQRLVDRRVQEVSSRGMILEHAWVRLGRRIEPTVITAAKELESGLLVVGARGGSVSRRHVLGDLSVALVRDAPCSVLVVHAQRLRSPPRSAGAQHEGNQP
jgi:nucleotide-binding universal stress UspA family protein